MIFLDIAGAHVPAVQLPDYAVRFVRGEDGELADAELYHHGQRVTGPWKLALLCDHTLDPGGGNANTA